MPKTNPLQVPDGVTPVNLFPLKNPFPEFVEDESSGIKVKSQRHEDWDAGYSAGFVAWGRANPGAGDVVAGSIARAFLGAVSPSVLKQLKLIGLEPGISAKKIT